MLAQSRRMPPGTSASRATPPEAASQPMDEYLVVLDDAVGWKWWPTPKVVSRADPTARRTRAHGVSSLLDQLPD